MSNNPEPRPSYLPGRDFDQLAIPITRQPRRNWFRVHRSGTSAIQFGIRAHHRFSHANCPFPLLYAGASFSVCLWEYFGDEIFAGRHVISAARWNTCSLSRISIPSLKVCALSLEATRNVMGVDKASLLAADIGIPQQWGLAVQQHPATFEGIKYSSRFVNQACLALFDRGRLTAKLQETFLGELQDLDAAVDWLDEQGAALV
ncbi:MAG TPA: RES family NAD+ phosphorylase [Candidatus Sulfotelmatobacter sp.]|nr:RES family NAD+ phosphorylase [Candidatus Sulfotelmatobacter sp.]